MPGTVVQGPGRFEMRLTRRSQSAIATFGVAFEETQLLRLTGNVTRRTLVVSREGTFLQLGDSMAPPTDDCSESELVPRLLLIPAEETETRQDDDPPPDHPVPLPLQQREVEYG